MQKRTLLLTIFLIFFLQIPKPILSHPLDITYTTLTPKNDGIYGRTYIHPFELGLLIGSQGINENNSKELFSKLDPYFQKNFQVMDGRKKITLEDIVIEQVDVAKILDDGLYIDFKIPLIEKTSVYKIIITLFLSDFATQTNKLLLLDRRGKIVADRPVIYFTKFRKEWELNLNSPDFSYDIDDNIDTDKDGLSNHLEKLYGTDSLKTDTDRDGYSDFDEFYMGWDPVSYRSVKGQQFMYLNQKNAMNSAYKNTEGFSDSARYFGSDEPIVITNQQNGSVVVKKQELPERLLTKEVEPAILDYWLFRFCSSFIDNEIEENLNFIFGFLFLLGLLHLTTLDIKSHPWLSSPSSPQRSLHQTIPENIIFIANHFLDILLAFNLILLSTHIIHWVAWIPSVKIVAGVLLFVFTIIYIVNGFHSAIAKRKLDCGPQSENCSETPNRKPDWLFHFINNLKPFNLKWIIFLFLISACSLASALQGLAVFALGILTSLIIYRILYSKANRIYTILGTFSVFFTGIMMLLIIISILFPASS